MEALRPTVLSDAPLDLCCAYKQQLVRPTRVYDAASEHVTNASDRDDPQRAGGSLMLSDESFLVPQRYLSSRLAVLRLNHFLNPDAFMNTDKELS